MPDDDDDDYYYYDDDYFSQFSYSYEFLIPTTYTCTEGFNQCGSDTFVSLLFLACLQPLLVSFGIPVFPIRLTLTVAITRRCSKTPTAMVGWLLE